ncbi:MULTISPECIES: sensor histidine kinase [Streptomyces]|uniref:histidine kinase n=1 Tax=Streptomyces griseus subsp. griseus (strain JCM 4626 / CBS 651.72 / NBRC 13350 / KCC S-0626 / ISP 5235) TaxID=455632 RepID=B1VR89_STRGG|nr:sensor histidine kinase [Streptomyces griseus]BAG20740.1 putative two-component system sensor kinase [Streptomyces griseus subsp. griseus NBRC 13350]SEE75490.1 Signal transduction histidine kinase [Streptomyces griseus]SQA21670.1 two-component system sensor kinase [Streptomyces griseus]
MTDHPRAAGTPQAPDAAPAPPPPVGTGGTVAPLTRIIRDALDRLRAFDRRRPRVWDAAVTGFWVVAAVLDYTSGGWRTVARDDVTAPEPLVLLMSVCFSLPLLWRRGHPMAVLLVMAPASLVNIWTGAVVQAALLQLIPVFHIVLRSSFRTVGAAAALFVAPVLAIGVRIPSAWGQEVVSYVWGLVFVVLLGIAVRTRREYTEALVERAHRLERERDQQARLAAAAERTRIAREMHDIIGHNLSVITSLADGGAYAARKNPERAGQALEAIGATSRQALSELRRLLGVLRDAGAEAGRAPQPTLDELAPLIERVRRAGLPVHLELEGDPRALSITPGRQLTVYRVVQEALTNTLKHATGPTSATVTLTCSHTHLDARITDTGTGAGPAVDAEDAVPPTQGIMGMRERAALYDGTVEAGPLPNGGGWQIRLRLPLEDTPP